MKWSDFKKAGHPRTLFAAFLYFDVSFMVWVLIGCLGVSIAETFGLNPAQKGLLAAVPLLGGALTRIPVGLLADRYGSKRIGLATLAVVSVPLVWGWLFASSFAQMLCLGLLLGVAGSSFAVALPLASRWYPKEQQGLALGIAGAGNSGTVIASLFAARLAQRLGWHAVFGLALAAIAAVFIVFAVLAKEPPRPEGAQKKGPRWEIFKQPDTAWFSLIYAVTFGGFVGLASFLGLLLCDQYGLPKFQAANFTALCVFAGSFFRPVGGFLADRFGGAKTLTAVLAAVAACFIVLGTLPPLPVAAPLFALLMACLGLGNGSVFQLVPQRFSEEIGLATGIVGAVGGLGGFWLPSLLGFSRQWTGSFGPGLWGLGLTAGAALFAVAAAQRGLERHKSLKAERAGRAFSLEALEA